MSSSDNLSRPPSYEETRPFLSGYAEYEQDKEHAAYPPAPAPIPVPVAEDSAPQYAHPCTRRRRRRVALLLSFFVVLTYVAGFFVMSQSFHQAQHHSMHMQHHALGTQDIEDGMWAKTITQKTVVELVPGASRPSNAHAEPMSFEECAKLDGGGSIELETIVHHGGAFFVGPSFSGARELNFVRDGPVGVWPPHKHPHHPPHKKPGHGPPKLPIPSGWPKPPHLPHHGPDDDEEDHEQQALAHPPKDHPKPYNVSVHVSRDAKHESDLFICSYKVPLFGIGVGAFGFVSDTIRPLRPSANASTIHELAVKVHLPEAFPATAVGFRAPIVPFRPVPAPPATRIMRVTTVFTQRLSDLKNRIKEACHGRKAQEQLQRAKHVAPRT